MFLNAEKLTFLGVEFPAKISEGETLCLTEKLENQAIFKEEENLLFKKVNDSKTLKRSL